MRTWRATRRCLLAVAVVWALGSGVAQAGRRIAGGSRPADQVTAGAGHYVPPLAVFDVVRGFDPPATRYGAGHLGVDLMAARGAQVRAAAAGIVTFAGSVAGRGLVVLLHPDGVRTEYEPVHVVVSRGQTVSAGTLLGRVRGSHVGCPVASCLHWGARRGVSYLDPLSLLRPLGTVRLLPWRT